MQNLVAIILRPVLTLMKIKGEGAPAFIQCHVLESIVLNVLVLQSESMVFAKCGHFSVSSINLLGPGLESVAKVEKEGVDEVMKRKEGQGQVARMLATRKRCHGCAPLLSQ